MFVKKIIPAVVLALFLFSGAAYSQANEKCADHLFQIGKSDNKNVLFYDAKITNGKLDAKAPVVIYWIMYAEKGQRENLAMLEKSHFDITKKEVEPGVKYIINVKDDMLKKRNITVTLKDNGCAEAVSAINGKEAVLKSLFIDIKSKTFGVVTGVNHIEFVGQSVSDGSQVSEKLIPK